MSDTPETPQGPADDLMDDAAIEQRAATELPVTTGAPATTADAAEPESRLSRKAAWLAMGAVTLALALIWIAPGIEHVDEATDTGGATAGAPGEPEDAAAVGKPARLDFKLKDMNGVDVRLDSFKGKVILLNFWATWCGPCRTEIPELVTLVDEHKAKGFEVVGVSIDDSPEQLRAFAQEMKMNYPSLLMLDDLDTAFGPMWALPTTFLIDRNGSICLKHMGPVTKEMVEREIKGLL